MSKIDIPPRKEVLTTGFSDPARFYYHPILRYPFIKRLEIILKLISRKGSSVLDVGYGSGIFFLELNKRFDRLCGIDLHDKNNAVEKTLLEKNIIADLRIAEASELPYGDNEFDCVVSVSTLEHVKNLEKVIRAISRVLKDDGEAILGFPSDNLIMRSLYYLFDSTPCSELHLSNGNEIISKIKDTFNIEKMITFPYLFPARMAFYIGLRCVKKRAMR